LFINWLPANKYVVRDFTFKDEFELLLKLSGTEETCFSATFIPGQSVFLSLDPVPNIGIGQFFKVLAVKLMIIDQNRETVLPTVPNLPDEWSLMKELTVLLKKPIPQPVL
jgi:hypothetical protein